MIKHRFGEIKFPLGWYAVDEKFPSDESEVLVFSRNGEVEEVTVGRYIDGEWVTDRDLSSPIEKWTEIFHPDFSF